MLEMVDVRNVAFIRTFHGKRKESGTYWNDTGQLAIFPASLAMDPMYGIHVNIEFEAE